MDEPYVKEMIQRDIEEKNHIKNTIKKLNILQVIVSIIGVGIMISFIVNIYYTRLAIHEVLYNRKETIINRSYGDSILRKLDNLKTYTIKQK